MLRVLNCSSSGTLQKCVDTCSLNISTFFILYFHVKLFLKNLAMSLQGAIIKIIVKNYNLSFKGRSGRQKLVTFNLSTKTNISMAFSSPRILLILLIQELFLLLLVR